MALSYQCEIELPEWAGDWLTGHGENCLSQEEQMRFVIELASENVRQGTGGPFGAAIFDNASGAVVSVGTNRVTASGLSIAHAEMVAISLAQHRLGGWNLSDFGDLTLATSCEPCAMCFGAVPWSGVRGLICGARKSDAEAAGFDEGEKPGTWVQALRDRGISVDLNVLREEAAELFTQYGEAGGIIYNASDEDK